MKKEEKIEALKQIESNPRVSNFWCDKNILKRGREDSVWYDSDVISFVIDNRYMYFCRACGEVRITHIPTDDDVVSKGFNASDVVEFLEKHGYRTDKQVCDAESKGELYFGNNNWFEDQLFDRKKGQWIDFGLEVAESPFPDLDYLFNIIENRAE